MPRIIRYSARSLEEKKKKKGVVVVARGRDELLAYREDYVIALSRGHRNFPEGS